MLSTLKHMTYLSFLFWLLGVQCICCLLGIPCVGTILGYMKLFLEQPVESKAPQLKELCIRPLNHLYASKRRSLVIQARPCFFLVDIIFIWFFFRQRLLELFLKETHGHESESSKSKRSYRELKVRAMLILFCFFILG